MRKIVEEVSGEGLDCLLGEKVVIYSCRFIYTGVLKGINTTCILLSDAKIVYDTGAHQKGKTSWETCENTWSSDWYIQLASIESFGKSPF